MERRSRSTSRHHSHYHTNGLSSLQPDYSHYNGNHRHSTHFDSPASLTNGLLMRPGGDSRTLSPDRRNASSNNNHNHEPYQRGGSYNQYTMQQPSRIVPGGGNSGPQSGIIPPPRPPTSSPPKSTSTPQTSPPSVPPPAAPASVKYADEYSLSLKKTNDNPEQSSASTSAYASGRVGVFSAIVITV